MNRARDLEGMSWLPPNLYCTIRLKLSIANFKHQRRDVQLEFKMFACGLVCQNMFVPLL